MDDLDTSSTVLKLCAVNCYIKNATGSRMTLNKIVLSTSYSSPYGKAAPGVLETIAPTPNSSLLSVTSASSDGAEVHYNVGDEILRIKWERGGNKTLLGSFLKPQEIYRIEKLELPPQERAVQLTISIINP